jgi:hypothetical protein
VSNWNLEQAQRDAATLLGESIAEQLGLIAPPISPFRVIDAENGRVLPFGDDFGDAFDGRLEYQSPRFLLFFNTKYDAWSHAGQHHPKVNFTVAHELGHYFLDHHRKYLQRSGKAHSSLTEFQVEAPPEREADCFAAGLLMPRSLLEPTVNAGPPTFPKVRSSAKEFDVSLTSMAVRWVQLSHFPCAILVVGDGQIQWGFTSDALKRAGGYRVRKGEAVTSRPAVKFLSAEASLTIFREGKDSSPSERWIDWEREGVWVQEWYTVIPTLRQMLIFLAADEDDVLDDEEDD